MPVEVDDMAVECRCVTYAPQLGKTFVCASQQQQQCTTLLLRMLYKTRVGFAHSSSTNEAIEVDSIAGCMHARFYVLDAPHAGLSMIVQNDGYALSPAVSYKNLNL